jgi:hypothetical protein
VTSYDFRLPFILPESSRIQSDAERLELLALRTGEHLRLLSGSDKPIKDHPEVALIGGSFASEAEARKAAEKSKQVLLYWAIKYQVGIDFRVIIPQQGFVTNAGLAYFQAKAGFPLRAEIPGIDVYEHKDELKFIKFEAKAIVGHNEQNLVSTFTEEYSHEHHFSDKLLLASEIFASSFFDVSPRSRFITLVTSVEVLLEQLTRHDDVKRLLDEIASRVKTLRIDEPTQASIVGQLGQLKRQSIGEAARALIHRLIPDEIFDSKPPVKFFIDSYNVRSDLVHEGQMDKSIDVPKLVSEMQRFVKQLLLAQLNSPPIQSADDLNRS